MAKPIRYPIRIMMRCSVETGAKLAELARSNGTRPAIELRKIVETAVEKQEGNNYARR